MILKQLEKDYKLNENDLFIARYILEHSEEILYFLHINLLKKPSQVQQLLFVLLKLGFESYNDFKLNIHSFKSVLSF